MFKLTVNGDKENIIFFFKHCQILLRRTYAITRLAKIQNNIVVSISTLLFFLTKNHYTYNLL